MIFSDGVDGADDKAIVPQVVLNLVQQVVAAISRPGMHPRVVVLMSCCPAVLVV